MAVGLVGAGPWANMVHAPVLAAGPETRLAGVWARRPEAARETAAKHGAPAFESFDALLDACEAVAFCVPPDVQPEYAIRAAKAGKALLLEKPLADDLPTAERVAAAASAVPTLMVLSYRFAAGVRAKIEEARAFDAYAARGMYVSGAFLPGSPFAFGWRLKRGALLDIGPHIIDLASAALGDVVELRAHGDPLKMVTLDLQHGSGIYSQLVISATVGVARQRVSLELFGKSGVMEVDPTAFMGRDVFPTVRAEFAAIVRSGGRHPLGVERGLYLQRIISEAEKQLAGD